MSYSLKSIRKKFAEHGVFYTDEKLAKMLKEVIEADGREVTDVYDPTCGSGNLLAVFPDNVRKWGQELDPVQAEEASKRLVNATIAAGDTLVSPDFTDRKFKHIVANYPFSVKWIPFSNPRWGNIPCLPPPSKADYAFLLHIISMMDNDGVAAILCFPGICYRGQREGQIRKWIIQQNLIAEVRHIPGGFFEDTQVATVMLILRKGKTTTDILFVDTENRLQRIVKYEEIEQNDFSLSVTTYVQKEEPKREVDPVALEKRARADVLRRVKAQLEFSSQAVELHKVLGLPPLPPVSDFVSDLITQISPYAKENRLHLFGDD